MNSIVDSIVRKMRGNVVMEQRTPGSAHLAFTLSVLTSAGGLFGYMKAKSQMSAFAGIAFGGAFAAAGYFINEGNVPLGYDIATGASFTMCAAMSARFMKTKKVMPSGVLASIGLLSAGYYTLKSIQERE